MRVETYSLSADKVPPLAPELARPQPMTLIGDRDILVLSHPAFSITLPMVRVGGIHSNQCLLPASQSLEIVEWLTP